MSLVAALFTVLLATQAATPAQAERVRLHATLQSFSAPDTFAVSRNGRFLAVATTVGGHGPRRYDVVVIDTTTRREVARTSLPEFVMALAFSHDGRRLAVAMSDRKIEIWTSDLTRRAHRFEALGSAAVAFVFGEDDGSVVSIGSDGTCVRWDLTGSQPLKVVLGGLGDNGETHIAVSNNNGWLATFNGEGKYAGRRVRLYRLEGTVAARELAQGDRTWGIAVSNDGRTIASSAEGSLTLRDVASDTGRLVSIGKEVWAYHATFSPDGHVLAVTSDAGLIFVRVASGQILRTVRLPGPTLQSQIRFTPDGRGVFVGSDAGLCLVDATTGATRWFSTGAGETNLGFSRDGHRFVARASKHLRAWDTTTWSEVAADPRDAEALDERRPYRAARAEVVSPLLESQEGIRSIRGCDSIVATSLDGRWFLCNGYLPRTEPSTFEHAVHVIDSRSAKIVASMGGQTASTPSARFSADAQWLASISVDGALHVWDISGLGR